MYDFCWYFYDCYFINYYTSFCMFRQLLNYFYSTWVFSYVAGWSDNVLKKNAPITSPLNVSIEMWTCSFIEVLELNCLVCFEVEKNIFDTICTAKVAFVTSPRFRRTFVTEVIPNFATCIYLFIVTDINVNWINVCNQHIVSFIIIINYKVYQIFTLF